MNKIRTTYSSLIILFLFCFIQGSIYSQNTESADTINTHNKVTDWAYIKGRIEREIKDQFPRMRFIDINYRRYTPANISYWGNDISKTKAEFHDSQNLEVSLNVPFYIKPKVKLVALARYDYNNWNMKNYRTANNNSPHERFFKKETSHVYNTGVLGSYLFSALGKITMLNFQLIGEGSVKGYENFIGIGYATMILKQSQQGSMSIGLVAMLDRQSPVPIIPTFTYTKKLDNGWALDVFLPKHVFIRKSILKNSRITLGADIDSKRIYLESKDNKMYIHKHNEFKLVSFYDHHFSEQFIFSFGGELINSFGGKMMRSNKSQKNYLMKSSQNMNFNIQTSISYSFSSK